MLTLIERINKMEKTINEMVINVLYKSELLSQLQEMRDHIVDPITPEAELVQILNEYFGDAWSKFSWRWTFVDDLLSIENIEVDGTPLFDFVAGDHIAEELQEDFYNEIDYHSLMNRNITEVRRVNNT